MVERLICNEEVTGSNPVRSTKARRDNEESGGSLPAEAGEGGNPARVHSIISMPRKRVFIIHGWDGLPEDGWFPWLADKLEERGFEVNLPLMPHTAKPEIRAWVSHLKEIVGNPNSDTYFVGHSIGAQTILRYLEGLPRDANVGGAVFVAGWFTLANLDDEEEWKIATPWIETPIDCTKVLEHTKKFIAIFSDNDRFVPPENEAMFQERLGVKTVIEHDRGHFMGLEGVVRLPSALEAVLEMAHE